MATIKPIDSDVEMSDWAVERLGWVPTDKSIPNVKRFLGPIALDLITRVEKQTGYPVQMRVVQPGDYGWLISFYDGGEGIDHILSLAPKALHSGYLDYLVAQRCGVALRHFSLPPGDRRLYVRANKAKAREILSTRASAVRAQLPKTFDILGSRLVSLVADYWIKTSGMILNLAEGTRVDSWLHKEYPSLRSQQVRRCEEDYSEWRETLEWCQSTGCPTALTKRFDILSAAAFLFTAHLLRLDMPDLTSYIDDSGFSRKLFEEAWETRWDGPETDVSTAARWAEYLGVPDWIEWATGSGVVVVPTTWEPSENSSADLNSLRDPFIDHARQSLSR